MTSVALYLIDLEGTHLRRLAGSEEFPDSLAAPLAIGPELPREGLAPLRALIARELPGSALAPLSLRGRAPGVLLAVDAPADALTEPARQAAASLALAARYTDVFDRAHAAGRPARRRRSSRICSHPASRASRAPASRETCCPATRSGATGSTMSRTATAAGWASPTAWGPEPPPQRSAPSPSGRSAKRKFTGDLHAATLAIHRAVREIAIADAFVNAIIARWHGPSSTFSWIACGGQSPLRIDARGDVAELPGVLHDALGLGAADRCFAIQRHRLAPGERLLLLSDGVLDRHTDGAGRFGLAGVTAALHGRPGASPAETFRALQDAILDRSLDPLEDDATIVVLAPNGREPRPDSV